MHRILVTGLVSVAACLGLATAAQASDPDPVVPPAFVPPTPAPVIDTDTAAAFTERFADRFAGRLLRQDRRRVRVLDTNAACLQSLVVATRYGCVFTLRALVISRVRGWDGWDHAAVARKSGGDPRSHRRFRIRNYGCLGGLSVNGGPTATPSASLRFLECGRVPRGDIVAPEPV